MTDDVQPDAGQGGEATGGLFDSYLQAVPEEHRETVTGYLKDAEKNVNSRLEKAAQLEKNMGPYQQVEALSRYQPEQLSELLAWHEQVTASDEAFQDWLGKAAEEAGFTRAEAQQLEDAEQDGVLSQEKIEQLIAEKAADRVAPLEEKLSQFEEQRTLNEVADEVRADFARLEKEHGELDQDAKQAIVDLGKDYDGDGSWVQAGFERLQQIASGAQRDWVAGRSGQPGGSVAAGGVEAFKPTTDFKEAGRQLRERLRQAS